MRIREVRREIAQLQTVLRNRERAVDVAAAEPELAEALAGTDWYGDARFSYEDSAWQVTFTNADGDELATAMVDLNKKRVRGRRARREGKPEPQQVLSYEIAQ